MNVIQLNKIIKDYDSKLANITIITARHKRAFQFHQLARRYNTHIRVIRNLMNEETGKKEGDIEITVPVDTEGIWWDRKKMTDPLPRDYNAEPRLARTAFSLQGSASASMIYLVDHATLLAISGGLYTSVTRAHFKDQVKLIDCTDKELEWLAAGIVRLETPKTPKPPVPRMVYHHPIAVQRFPYLKSRGDGMAVLDHPLEENNLVVRRDQDGYYLFQDHQAFLELLPTIPAEERCFHEVVLGGPYKIYFDVDAKVEDLEPLANSAGETTGEFFHSLINRLLQEISDCVYLHFPTHTSGVTPIICHSAETGEKTKYSVHIILNTFVVESLEIVKAFAQTVCSTLPELLRGFIDLGVYKPNQTLRMLGCTKPGVSRFKVIHSSNPDVSPYETFLTYTGGLPLYHPSGLTITPKVEVSESVPVNVAEILEEFKEKLVGHRYRGVTGGYINFTRTHATHCEFCERIHSGDNTLYLKADDIGVYMGCRHHQGGMRLLKK
jgi:hypothetical protein